jgi:hypothetical protein
MGDIVPISNSAVVARKAFDPEKELAEYEQRLKEVGTPGHPTGPGAGCAGPGAGEAGGVHAGSSAMRAAARGCAHSGVLCPTTQAQVLEEKLKKINEEVPTRIYNVMGSAAGAGSGDFHHFRQVHLPPPPSRAGGHTAAHTRSLAHRAPQGTDRRSHMPPRRGSWCMAAGSCAAAPNRCTPAPADSSSRAGPHQKNGRRLGQGAAGEGV